MVCLNSWLDFLLYFSFGSVTRGVAFYHYVSLLIQFTAIEILYAKLAQEICKLIMRRQIKGTKAGNFSGTDERTRLQQASSSAAPAHSSQRVQQLAHACVQQPGRAAGSASKGFSVQCKGGTSVDVFRCNGGSEVSVDGGCPVRKQ